MNRIQSLQRQSHNRHNVQLCSQSVHNARSNIMNGISLHKQQHCNFSLYLATSQTQSHRCNNRFNINHNHNHINNNHIKNNSHSYFQISKRFRLPNPRLAVNAKQAAKIDWRKDQTGKIDSGYKHEMYENLDWTNQDFLDDMDSEHLKNTYPEWHKHWMKNFIKFTDNEFDNFNFYNTYTNTTRSNRSNTDGIDDDIDGELDIEPDNGSDNFNFSNANNRYGDLEIDGESIRVGDKHSEIDGANRVSDSLQYLHEWQALLEEKKRSFKDDYEVFLPNGSKMPFRQYIESLNMESDGKQQKQGADGTEGESNRLMPKLDKYGRAEGRGKRKTSLAKALVYPGNGNVYVNGTHWSQYFGHHAERLNVFLPFLVTDTHRELDAYCVVQGGGPSGRSSAIRTAIAKALANYDPRLIESLAPYRLLTTDARRKERKKPGKKGARKSERWSRR